MLRAIRQWVWKGTLEPDLETPPPESLLEDRDLTELWSKSIRESVAEFEAKLATIQRKRALENPREGAHSDGGSENDMKTLARSMLPTLDALDRIIEFGDNNSRQDEVFGNWLTSIKALRTRLLRTMEGIGLTAINSVGMEVDLEIHDVVSVVAAGKFPANSVVSEQQRGYYYRGKLLRDAKVVVAQ